MALNWRGDELLKKIRSAQRLAVDATMQEAVKEAKADHGPGAHAIGRFRSSSFASLERGIRIVQPAAQERDGVAGRWGVKGIVYARRIELGFQGKDSLGRVYNYKGHPYLRPAADSQYPRVAERIRREMKRGGGSAA